MKATGIVRQLDSLGRVVIPMELRRTMDIEEKDGLEIFVDGERIILQKYAPGCAFCGESVGEMKPLFGKRVCPVCVSKISEVAEARADKLEHELRMLHDVMNQQSNNA